MKVFVLTVWGYLHLTLGVAIPVVLFVGIGSTILDPIWTGLALIFVFAMDTAYFITQAQLKMWGTK